MASDANKHVCEVQLVHRSLLTARRGLPGHVIYGVVRNSTEVLEFLGLLSGQRGAGLLALVEDGWSPEAIERMGFVLAGGEDTVGVSEALVAKDWNLLAIERMGLPVTMEMRDARMEVLKEKGCDREAILREGLSLPFGGHGSGVRSVCVTPDGKHVVTGAYDKTAGVWLLSDGSLVHALQGHTNRVYSVCVTPDGKHVVTGSVDKTVRIWLLSDGSLVRTLEGHTNGVSSVFVTADGMRVVTASKDKTARVWLLSDGSLVRTLEGHTDTVSSVCVTADGKHVVTGSNDRTARIWLRVIPLARLRRPSVSVAVKVRCKTCGRV